MGFLSDVVDSFTGKTAAEASERAAQMQADSYRQAMAQQAQYMQPFYQSGLQAQNRLMNLLGLSGDTQAQGYGSMAKPFSIQDFEQDPGYAFRMSEGLKALERSAAGRGGAASGAAMKGITQYGQNLASQEYQNAFNRYQTNRQNILNPLLGLTGAGRGAAGSLGNIYGQGITGAGEAEASGVVGAANARQQGINNLINLGMLVAGGMTGNPMAALGGLSGMGGGFSSQNTIYGQPQRARFDLGDTSANYYNSFGNVS